MKTCTAFFASMLISAGALAQYAGTVTKNGAPAPGVAVSDGLNVVLTDAHGGFSLKGHGDARFIFITSPAGFRPEKTHYLRIAPETARYDFNLVTWKPSGGETASFIHWADTETGSGRDTWVRDCELFSKENGVAFIVHTGDICYRYGLKFHGEKVTSQSLGIPTHYCVGNHDLLKDTPYGEQYFEEMFGPAFYSFDAGPAHFVITPMRSGDAKPSYTIEKVAAWLKNDLAAMAQPKPLVIFNHNLPAGGNNFTYGNIDLRAQGLKAWIYGHYHVNVRMNHDGIVSICSAPPNKGGINHDAACFPLTTIGKEGVVNVEQRYCFVSRHLAIVSPKAGTTSAKVPIIVSAYDSASRVKNVSAKVIFADGTEDTMDFLPVNSWLWESKALAKDAKKLIVTAAFKNGTAIEKEETISTQAVPVPKEWEQASWEAPYKDSALTAKAGEKLQRKLKFTELWTARLPGQCWMASPVIANGMAFFATTDDANCNNCGVTALDLKTGAMKWSFKSPNSVSNGLHFFNGKILFCDVEGNVFALNASDGKTIWNQKVNISAPPPFTGGNVLDNGIYYAGSGKALKAFKADTGEILWEKANWTRGEGTPTPNSVAGNMLLWSAQWSSVNALDKATGALLWENKGPSIRFRGAGVVSAPDGNLATISQKSFFLLSPATGEVVREVEKLGSLTVAGPPLFHKSMVIFSTADKGILALNTSDYTPAWSFETGKSLVASSPYRANDNEVQAGPVLINGMLLAAAGDGMLYMLNPEDGTMMHNINLGSPVFAPPAAIPASENTPGLVIVNDFAGTAHALILN